MPQELVSLAIHPGAAPRSGRCAEARSDGAGAGRCRSGRAQASRIDWHRSICRTTATTSRSSAVTADTAATASPRVKPLFCVRDPVRCQRAWPLPSVARAQRLSRIRATAPAAFVRRCATAPGFGDCRNGEPTPLQNPQGAGPFAARRRWEASSAPLSSGPLLAVAEGRASPVQQKSGALRGEREKAACLRRQRLSRPAMCSHAPHVASGSRPFFAPHPISRHPIR